MMGQENREVERKLVAILKVLNDSPKPLGGKIIARRLNDFGIDLGERTVRYHLKLMDQRGLTCTAGIRDGRSITQSGIEELENALVSDRVGSIITKIESLAYWTTLDLDQLTGEVPINTSLFPKEKFAPAIEAMKDTVRAGLCVSDLVAVAFEGQRLGEVTVPQGMTGLATVSSVVISGTLLKSGIPVYPKFGGLLQIRNYRPLRFIELIEYSGCSLDPSEMFIASRMTSVNEVARNGEGKIAANYWEMPAPTRPAADAIIKKLTAANLGGLVIIGEIGQSICETSVRPNTIGMVLQSGLNPVAAAVEAKLDVVNYAMSGVISYKKLTSFWGL